MVVGRERGKGKRLAEMWVSFLVKSSFVFCCLFGVGTADGMGISLLWRGRASVRRRRKAPLASHHLHFNSQNELSPPSSSSLHQIHSAFSISLSLFFLRPAKTGIACRSCSYSRREIITSNPFEETPIYSIVFFGYSIGWSWLVTVGRLILGES